MIRIKNRPLKKIFWFVLAAALLWLAVVNFVIYPSFTGLMVQNTEEEAIVTARHISHMMFSEEGGPALITPEITAGVEKLVHDFNLMKLKVFSADGTIILSTDPADIGRINKEKYFHDIVAQGGIKTELVRKDSASLEGQKVTVDVVETYVPVMRNNAFVGALEIYYDISDKNRALRKVMLSSHGLSIGLTIFFLIIIIAILLQLDRSLSDRKKAYLELEESNTALTLAKAVVEGNRNKLQDAFNRMSSLIQEVITTQNIHLQFENPHLDKCYEIMECNQLECPCYGKEPTRCWQIAGTFCGGRIQGSHAQKYGNCTKCQVFKDAASDPVGMIGEHFNNMMHLLEIKHRELEDANVSLQEVKEEQATLITSLQEALAEIKTLRGIVPICSSCKKIRDDKGYWNKVESYVQQRTEARFSHGICPECSRKLYPELFEDGEKAETDIVK